MSNFGLELAIRESGLEFHRAAVGDRYVLEMLNANGWTLGGESSGHIICLDLTSTGDGIISALQVLEAMLTQNVSLAELVGGMNLFPQTLVNVRVQRRAEGGFPPEVHSAVAAVEAALCGEGRVLLRPSGTEPVIRVMVEGRNRQQVADFAAQLADTVHRSLANPAT
jgi:phosphoglucosamine mutase